MGVVAPEEEEEGVKDKLFFTTPWLFYIVLVYGSDLNLHCHLTFYVKTGVIRSRRFI